MGLTTPIFGGRTTTPGAAALLAFRNGTYDFNTIQNACDHQQHLERYQISPTDLRTLQYVSNPSINMRGPINGVALVQIFIHGELITPTDPTYGYQILPDPNRIQISGSNEKFYKIVFNREVRLIRPLIEVNYLTRQIYCLKCNGLGILSDLNVSVSGSLLRVYGLIKLSQRVLKMVLTSRCAFYPQFTCPIKNYIGRKFGINITDADIANAIVNAVNNLKQIQIAQNGFQSLAPEETLRDFTNISALQDPSDPTIVHVSGTVISYTSSALNALVTAPIDFTFTVQG